ncbi:hypothetical protein WG907_04815 [Sphingobium sp. AN558]|uniref:hypothetical protein n=1 Tax=Sphingobium sp. AN558 TaxID=3133442 RepID=UPI0030BF13B8
MREDPIRSEPPPSPEPVYDAHKGSGVIFVIVALALLLAIGFFYLTNDRRDDRRADAVTKAAGSLDDAAKKVGDAAKDAANSLRKDK